MIKRAMAVIMGLWVWMGAYGSITGAGSSFVYPLMARWSQAYAAATHEQVNYQSIGSGGGISQLQGGTVQFAAIDMALDPKTLNDAHWAQFPLVMGGVVIAVNLPEVASDTLRLTGPVLADIFLGKITQWNDSAIQSLNPDLRLPAMAITVVHRADGSGTTYNFSSYLSAVSAAWAKQVGVATEVNWPAGIGGKGNSGAALFTQRIPGSISYLEYSFAKLTGLKLAQLQNRAGNFVKANVDSFQAAANQATFIAEHHFQQSLVDQLGENSWPIVAVTYVLMPTAQSQQINQKILDFIRFGWTDQREAMSALDYIPLADNQLHAIENYWRVQFHYKGREFS
jgi:phosphate transport system substrate-binding protein